MAMSMEPFNRLVKLVARAFYDDITLKGENQPKNGRSDNRGMAVVVLDALTRRQWVREEDLAKALKLHSKQLRRTLRFFEEEKLVARDHRRETAKGAKMFSAAVAATADGSQNVKEGEEKMKLHTHSYCCLDYAQIYDVARYRIHRMKKKLKDELENRNTIQEYICPACKRRYDMGLSVSFQKTEQNRESTYLYYSSMIYNVCKLRYSALDAAQLISPSGDCFCCEKCNTELVAESDKLAAEKIGEGDDNARRRHREKLKIMLQKIEEQLKPLTQQLARVKDLSVPEFGSLQAWEARNSVGQIPNGNSGANDSSRNSQGQGYGGTSMPFLGETRVEVDLSGTEVKGDNDGVDTPTTSLKVLPPWMIKEGMNLTKEQRGEVKSDVKIGSSSTTSDEKKPKDEKEDNKSIQDEYIKAYYAAYFKRQQEQEDAARKMREETSLSTGNLEKSSERQVGMKAKRDDYDEEDNVEWEDASTTGGANEVVKLNDLNVPADAFEDEDDEIDWEEG